MARIATFADAEASGNRLHRHIQQRRDQLLGQSAAKLLFIQLRYIAEIDLASFANIRRCRAAL
jgi:hypothetical protein